jgi:hypothetical protein
MTLMTERPATSGIEPDGFEALLDALVAVDAAVESVGFRAEIARGTIVLSPWSKGYYQRVMERCANS